MRTQVLTSMWSEVLRVLWDMDKPGCALDIFTGLCALRRERRQVRPSRSCVSVCLLRMHKEGLLKMKMGDSNKGYYRPAKKREQFLSETFNEISQNVAGKNVNWSFIEEKSDDESI